MNISLNWLKEYVDLDDLSIKDITEYITISGTKVEKYDPFGVKVEKVYTGLVKEVEDKNGYKIVKVSLNNKDLTILAKIDDIQVNDIVPVAIEGAVLKDKTISKFEKDGVTSEGMICHMSDLGLSKTSLSFIKSSGLISFPKDTNLNKDVNEVLGLGDYIIEFEITPNRVDCLSVEGIARELAVTLDRPLKKELYQDKKYNFNKVESKVKVKTDNCFKYVLNTIDDVKVCDSPLDMQIKLCKSGFSAINNIVDISNYILLEVGQPTHAFDSACVDGNILVRQAETNEKLVLLDGEEKTLSSNIMVIADDKKALGVAGIKGGLGSGITDNTKQVILEAATFKRGSIRNSSKKLDLRTDASTNFEKGLPKELTYYSINRFCYLIEKYNYGKVNNNVIDIDNDENNERGKIYLDYEKINKVLGITLDKETVDNILINLGFKIENDYCIVPYYREDVVIIEDIIEEVARIYGYDKLPCGLPNLESTFAAKTKLQVLRDNLKNISLANGFNEIYTYTFYSEQTFSRVYDKKLLKDNIVISNPLSIDFEYMRTTTIPHMLECLEKNYLKRNTDVKLFEIGKIFLEKDNIEKNKLPLEKEYLTLGMYSDIYDVYDIKNVINDVICKYKLDFDISRSTLKELHPGISGDMYIDNKLFASFGKVSPKIIKNYDLPENTYVALIDISVVLNNMDKEIKHKSLPKYPAVERDLCFTLDKNILSENVITAVKKSSDLVENIILFDEYISDKLGENKKSLAYKVILRDENKTLEEKEITKVIDNIIEVLDDKFKAELRK